MSTVDTRETFTGRVKWFSKAGYGFLTVVSANRTGDEIFVHYSELGQAPPRRYLNQGEYVEFYIAPATVEDGKDVKEKAVGVVGVFEGPLMCETVAEARAQAREREHERREREHERRERPHHERERSRERHPPRRAEKPRANDGYTEVKPKRAEPAPRREPRK